MTVALRNEVAQSLFNDRSQDLPNARLQQTCVPSPIGYFHDIRSEKSNADLTFICFPHFRLGLQNESSTASSHRTLSSPDIGDLPVRISAGRPAALFEDFRCFSRSIGTNAGRYLKVGSGRYLPHSSTSARYYLFLYESTGPVIFI